MKMNRMYDYTKIISFKSSPFGTCDINRVHRTVEVDDENNPKYKFQELLEFSNPKVENKFAICIGFNPAKAEEEIDTTNKRIINALQDDYSGYVLLNIYPEITEKASEINLDDIVNKEFFEDLVKQVDNFSSYNVILFFGTTHYITNNQKMFFDNLLKNNRLYKTTNDVGNFRHPASLGKVYIKEVCEADFITQNSIK